MADVTINAGATSGYVYGESTTCDTAQDTADGLSTGVIRIGQKYSSPNYRINESFLTFDTGAQLPDDATVTLATIKPTDLLLLSQGIGGTPSSRKLALGNLIPGIYSVKQYGAVGEL